MIFKTWGKNKQICKKNKTELPENKIEIKNSMDIFNSRLYTTGRDTLRPGGIIQNTPQSDKEAENVK